jgi:hypothetical protein
MKTTKKILLAASVMVLVLASKTAFGQGTLQTDPSQVDPSDILPAPTILQWPDNTFVPVTFDPLQITDNGGTSQSFVSNLSPSPVPEPSSLTLLTVGFIGAAIISLSRTKRNQCPNQQAGDAVTGLR